MLTLTFNVQGLAELDHALGALARADYRSRALRRAGEAVAAAARASFRTGEGAADPFVLTRRSGELSDSIRVSDDDLPRSEAVGTDLFWARFHEEGLGRFRARPFLEPALRGEAPGFRAIFEDEMARQIQELGLA